MPDQIPNACLAIIPGAAHLANLEQPDTFNQIIAAFAQNSPREKKNCPSPHPCPHFTFL
jgi:hypothetical protein